MKKQKIVNWFAFLIVVCLSCGNSRSQIPDKEGAQLLMKKLVGSWGGVEKNKYSELHFLNDSVYIPIQDSVYFFNQYSFKWIGEDTIQLRPFYQKYKVSVYGDTLKLTIKDELFEYERIKPEPSSLSYNYLNNFVIRRCNYLVSKNVITSQEAYEQLYDYIVRENLLDTTIYDSKDEYIPIETAH